MVITKITMPLLSGYKLICITQLLCYDYKAYFLVESVLLIILVFMLSYSLCVLRLWVPCCDVRYVFRAFVFLFVFVLCAVCQMLPVSLDCPYSWLPFRFSLTFILQCIVCICGNIQTIIQNNYFSLQIYTTYNVATQFGWLCHFTKNTCLTHPFFLRVFMSSQYRVTSPECLFFQYFFVFVLFSILSNYAS